MKEKLHIQASAYDDGIDTGTVLEKNKKRYLVVETDILPGPFKEFSLIRIYPNWRPLIRCVKNVYDHEIDSYIIIHY